MNNRRMNFISCPFFTSLNMYEYFNIDYSTHTDLLHHIIFRIQNTKYFTIDTKLDLFTNRPILIQIEIIDKNCSTVILVDVCRLPYNKASLKFWLIHAIFEFIFQSKNIIYSWGFIANELNKFLDFHLFTKGDIEKPTNINIQECYKVWYFTKYYYDENDIYEWRLQSAIYEKFQEYLNKTEQINQWNNNLRYQKKCAVNECLAITKLAYFLDQLNFDQ